MMIAGTRWQEGVWRSSPLPRRSCAPCYPPCSRVMCPSLGFHSPFLHCASLTSTEAEAVPAASKEFSEQLQQAPPPPLSAEIPTSRYGGPLLQPISVSVPYGNRQITIETGLMGRQASGAVTVTDGETILYSTACAAEEVIEPSDFAPLSVHYQERFSAAGRTSGGFFKREGRAKDHEILICRLIDRPLRPMIVKGFYHDTQLLSWVFSYDSIHSPEPLAIVAASAALALSDIPVLKTVGAVRVGLIDGKYIVNPTVPEMKSSRLDMIVAGAGRSVIMIEGCGEFVTEEEMLEAISVGQEAVAKVCDGIEELASRAGKTKRLETIHLPSPTIYKYIEELAADELVKALQIASKSVRKKAISLVESKVMDALTQSKDQSTQSMQSPPKEEEELLDFHEEVGLEDGLVDEGDLHVKPVLRKKLSEYFDPVDVKVAFKEVVSKLMRRLIIKNRRRSDGRGLTEIRPIQCSCNLLPRAHGSALFTRGETQALAVTTLGGDDMGQRLDNLTEIETKRFYLQYSFPPSSVGETGRVGAPSRREIGHGVLAEKALECALPSEESFPYTIRLESTITESNGSSSMASVCGGSLALMDAGIPLKYPIAGVAMGLILNSTETGEDSEPVILSDIIGAEDALGDMDFKIAGSETGITAFQMDIKADGLDLKILEMALLQARDGRLHILGEMAKCEPPPAKKLSKYAPLIEVFKVEPDKINSVIGSGGRTVRGIIEQSGVDSIDLEDDGSVRILARSAKAMESAKSKILGLTVDPLVGTIYRDCEVKSIVSFGCFLEIAPGREGLCHISELCKERIEKVEDILKVGDKVDVKLIEVNLKGQVRLSRRALLGDVETETATQETLGATSDGQTKEQKQVPKSEKASRASKDGQADATKQTRRTGRTSSASKDGQTEGKSKTYKTDIFIVPPRNGQTGAQKENLETEVQSSVSKDGGREKEKKVARSVAVPAEKKADSTEAVSADSTDVGVAERTAPVTADSTDVGVPQV